MARSNFRDTLESVKMDRALERARIPEPLTCPESGELMCSPLDKVSIGVYNKSIAYLDDDQAAELLVISHML